jgi:hypothetical protein
VRGSEATAQPQSHGRPAPDRARTHLRFAGPEKWARIFAAPALRRSNQNYQTIRTRRSWQVRTAKPRTETWTTEPADPASRHRGCHATPRPAGSPRSLSAPFRRVAILPATLRANRDETWLRLDAMVWVPGSVWTARVLRFLPFRYVPRK